jgi:hypothetical protein
MQRLNRNFTGRTYCNRKDTIEEGNQALGTHTNMQGQPMRNMIRNNIA